MGCSLSGLMGILSNLGCYRPFSKSIEVKLSEYTLGTLTIAISRCEMRLHLN